MSLSPVNFVVKSTNEISPPQYGIIMEFIDYKKTISIIQIFLMQFCIWPNVSHSVRQSEIASGEILKLITSKY